MTAPHFFAGDLGGERVVVSGDEARHAARVLRIRPGERITVGDGRGCVVDAAVVSVGAEVVAEVLGRRTEPPPAPRLVVWQAIPKAGKLDVVVQKLTEVGAAAVVVFAARRSVARWEGAKATQRIAHLGAVAREAAKQSRRAWMLDVRGVERLGDAPHDALILHEEAQTRLTDALPDAVPASLTLVVGPEGGLSHEEVELLSARGGRAVTLGPAVLRTETAALVAATVILARYGVIG